MARPKTAELTSRELAVMQVFWNQRSATAETVHTELLESGENLAYVTVANVIRGLSDKGFLKQTNQRRPFVYKAVRSFEQVSKRLVGDLLTRLFGGSRTALLVQLLDRQQLSAEERRFLIEVLEQQER